MDRHTARLSSQFLSYGLPFLYLLTSIAFYLHTYDSAQVKIERRFAKGYALMATYTASRFTEKVFKLNATDADYEKRLSRNRAASCRVALPPLPAAGSPCDRVRRGRPARRHHAGAVRRSGSPNPGWRRASFGPH